VPTIATRYIRTNVSAPNCSTIVLGGLITTPRNTSKNGIPYLSRLPGVGSLFRSTTKNRDRTELIVLMRPEVSLTKLDLYRLRQRNEDRSHFGPELEKDDCPDCPKSGDGKQLPPPDIPSAKGCRNALMKRIGIVFIAMLLACSGARGFILDEEIFDYDSVDPLAPSDGHGVLHQMPTVRDTDFARRYSRRWIYYFKANEQLMVDPAYVAALQRDLRRLGYYCGPINGLFSDEVSDGLARFQKNYSMRVTAY
jgi:hypothetical protein